ncbi:MAG: phosphoenolpyruvate synthase [Bacteroidaceae bacterium]|nr:phosphoenolpyruvate synthase [Bacteroidaceae bacterium]
MPEKKDYTSNYEFLLKDVSFQNLMTRRIFNVLLVANPYDAFILEDDGRIEEKLFDEYSRLGLRYPPRFTQVSTQEEAEKALEGLRYELVICMPNTDHTDVFDIARNIKASAPDTPLVVLTPFSHGITRYMEGYDLSPFEYVFCWLGNTDLMLSIIKLMEDKMNLEHDIAEGGVQMILLVEDGIRFYSSALPNLYNFVLGQSLAFATEALNSHERTLRMRGRPKIVLARTYEEAWSLYEKYSRNMLGVISDVRFPRNGNPKDPQAGLELLRAIRANDPFLPLIMQSAEPSNRPLAESVGAGYVDKNSKKMDVDLRDMVQHYFGFGDLVFRDPSSQKEIVRVHDLKDLQDNIFTIPEESLAYHASRNHISRWLSSRAMFPVADVLRGITMEKVKHMDDHRRIIYDAIVKYRKMKNQGVVAEYNRSRFDRFSNFARIGEGSLGGKGRGIAFIDNILKRHAEYATFDNAEIHIPKTLVLCTDIFVRFMDDNDLYTIALSDSPDEEILAAFLKGQLPEDLKDDVVSFCNVVDGPIAVRSSSLLEDSHYQPYAGVYATYMVPDGESQISRLAEAIKGVYASVFYRASKAYMSATSNVIDQEKMAVVLQEVVGSRHGRRFYPDCSGVARSLNFYPVGDEKAEEGVVDLALGLGKHIVDGGRSLRVSPAHPKHVMQTSDIKLALTETQTTFLALDLESAGNAFSVREDFDLLRLPVKDALEDGTLEWIGSTYDREDDMLYDSLEMKGRKVITFSGLLQYEMFPLMPIVQLALKFGEQEMRRPVEIEFAATFDRTSRSGVMYPLQMRPIVSSRECIDEDLTLANKEKLLAYSARSLGNGITNDVADVVYVRPGAFDFSRNAVIADEVRQINEVLMAEKTGYLLAGPGRWGSSDESLGIPVEWGDICGVQFIVELAIDGKPIQPSQGSHFFQNLTSFGVGYFTVNPFGRDGEEFFRMEILESLPALHETAYVRHVRFPKPFVVKMDGMKSVGLVEIVDNG